MTLPLTSSEIEHIAHETAKAAVRETLLTMGVNVNDPGSILKMQKDFAYLREWREAAGTVKMKAILVIVGIIVTGFAAAVWAALKAH